MELGSSYIDNFDQADREQVFKCIRDKTGRFLDDDDFMTYVETEEEKEKPKYVLTGDTKIALTDYYDAVSYVVRGTTKLWEKHTGLRNRK